MKRNIGKLFSFKLTDWEDPISGFVIDYNDDWTLLKYNPVDYIIDGYILFRNKNIEGLFRGAKQKWTEKVIKLKGLQPTDKEIIPLTDLETILEYLTDNFGVFQFYTDSETVCYLGKLKSLDSKKLIIDYLDTKGKWSGERKFKPGNFSVIEFNTDYINSLKLISATPNAD